MTCENAGAKPGMKVTQARCWKHRWLNMNRFFQLNQSNGQIVFAYQCSACARQRNSVKLAGLFSPKVRKSPVWNVICLHYQIDADLEHHQHSPRLDLGRFVSRLNEPAVLCLSATKRDTKPCTLCKTALTTRTSHRLTEPGNRKSTQD
jgi:hypothetical protein